MACDAHFEVGLERAALFHDQGASFEHHIKLPARTTSAADFLLWVCFSDRVAESGSFDIV